MSLPEENMLML